MQFSEAIMEYSFDCKIRKLSVKTIEGSARDGKEEFSTIDMSKYMNHVQRS